MFRFFSNDLAIDLGTANTLIYSSERKEENKGIVLNAPSVVAYNPQENKIIAVGHDAKKMTGRTPRDIKIVRPMRDGAIADFDLTERMLKIFIRQATASWRSIRRVIVSVPQGINEVEKRAVRDSCEHAGAREVYLISEPMAGAIGVGIDVKEPKGHLLVDIGGGTTEIAVISLGGIVVSESIKIAGDEMTEAIVSYFKRAHNIIIGDSTAENIKIQIGSAYPLDEEVEIEVRGRSILNGLPKEIVSNSIEIREALQNAINEIVNAILRLLDRTPPELASDIYSSGIILNGGGALLRGLNRLISKETSLPVHVAEDPLISVVLGTGKVLEDIENFSDVLIKNTRS
ncbi:MAG: rod shape-determining protein [Candidatus Kapaibacteriales bacterium]